MVRRVMSTSDDSRSYDDVIPAPRHDPSRGSAARASREDAGPGYRHGQRAQPQPRPSQQARYSSGLDSRGVAPGGTVSSDLEDRRRRAEAWGDVDDVADEYQDRDEHLPWRSSRRPTNADHVAPSTGASTARPRLRDPPVPVRHTGINRLSRSNSATDVMDRLDAISLAARRRSAPSSVNTSAGDVAVPPPPPPRTREAPRSTTTVVEEVPLARAPPADSARYGYGPYDGYPYDDTAPRHAAAPPSTAVAIVAPARHEPPPPPPTDTVPRELYQRTIAQHDTQAGETLQVMERLRAALVERDEDAQTLRKQLSDAKQDIFAARHELQLAKSEHADGVATVRLQLSQEKQRLLDEVLESKRQLTELSVKMKDLTLHAERATRLDHDLERAQLLLEKEQLLNRETRRELDEALSTARRCSTELGVCRDDVTVARDQMRALEAEANTLRSQLLELKTRSGERERALVEERDVTRSNAEAIVAASKDHLVAANAKIREKKQQVRDLKALLERAQQDSSARAQEHERECELLQHAVDTARKEAAAVMTKLDHSEGQRAVLQRALQELEARMGVAQSSAMADYEAKLKAAYAESDARQRALMEAENVIRDLEHRLTTHTHDAEAAKRTRDQTVAEATRMRDDVTILRAEATAAKRRADELQEKLDEAGTLESTLRRQVHATTSELAAATAELNRLKGAVAALRGVNQSMDQELFTAKEMTRGTSQRDSSISSMNNSSGPQGLHLPSTSLPLLAHQTANGHRSRSADAATATRPNSHAATVTTTHARTPDHAAVRIHSPALMPQHTTTLVSPPTKDSTRRNSTASSRRTGKATDAHNTSLGSVQSRGSAGSRASSVPLAASSIVGRSPVTSVRATPSALDRGTTPPLGRTSHERRRSRGTSPTSSIGSDHSAQTHGPQGTGANRVDASGKRAIETVLAGFVPAIRNVRPSATTNGGTRSTSADGAAPSTARPGDSERSATAAEHWTRTAAAWMRQASSSDTE
jgi:hypothetical protein